MSKISSFIKRRGILAFIEKSFYYPHDRYIMRVQRPKIKSLYSYIETNDYPDVGVYNKNKNNDVIISLTSFPKRFDQLVITLKSVILQDITPEKIIVYFGSDTMESDITDEMKSLEKYGVEYRFDNKLNLKGHKKYYYALKEFSHKNVITIDDDIIFPPTMISELLKANQKYPDAVCARRVHRIACKNGELVPYSDWDLEYTRWAYPSNRFLATTGAGTLYSPNVIKRLSNDTFDFDKIQELCLEADDIWMKLMEIKSSIKVVKADIDVMGAFIQVNEEDTLMIENVGNNKNDAFIKKVINHYCIDKKLLFHD